MIATSGWNVRRKGPRGLAQSGRDRPPTSVRPITAEEVRRFRVLIAVENMEPLAPTGGEKLACRRFSDPSLADQQSGLAVLEALLQEAISVVLGADE